MKKQNMINGINSPSFRLRIAIASVLFYIVLFFLVYRITGFTGTPILAVIPVIVIAWLYGTITGIFASLLCFPLNALLLTAAGISWIDNMIKTGGGVVGTLGFILIALIVGRLSDLGQRLRKELEERRRIEDELKQHRDKLEDLVLAKTSEIEASNQQLRAKTIELEALNEQLWVSQQDMQQARDYLEIVFRTSPDAIVVNSADGYVVMANDSVYDVYGYRPDELIGQHSSILTPEDENGWKESIDLVEQVFEQGSVRNTMRRRKHKDGAIIQVETSVVLLKDADGTVSGSVSSTRDITDRNRVEEQLLQSQKMEAIGTLAGGIAHDFNNILGAIIGYAELSQDLPTAGDDLQQNLSQILKASGRAKNLVQQILAFSRKSTTEQRPLQLHLIVKEALNLLRSSIPATISIKSDIATANDIVIADATQMHQIVMNLCTNAAHAMRQKGGMLDVTLKAIDLDDQIVRAYADIPAGPYVRLSIRDTGTGIPRDTLGRIFEPFFTTKESGEGTGMGLAVAHGIAKSLNGDIKVYSEQGKGTVFHVLLPRVQEKGAVPEVSGRSAPRGNERVLLVDDETVLLDVGEKLLSSLGYQVTALNSPLDALELFKKTPDGFDIVITDQTMPDMTGYELGQRLKELRSDIPVILCTGYSDMVTAESAIAGGLQAYVTKPLNRLSIAETLRSALEEKESGRHQ